jgi:hypothetical protein
MFGNKKTRWNLSVMLMLVVSLSIAANKVKADVVFGEPVNLGPTVNASSHEAINSLSQDGLTLFFDSNRSGGRGSFDIWTTTRPSISGPWSKPANLGSPVNTGNWDGVPSISTDGLSLIFSSNRPGGQGDVDLWESKRATVDDPWRAPVNLGPAVNSTSLDWTQCVSADGLELYLGSERPGGNGQSDIWVATRGTRQDDWSMPRNLGPTVNSSAFDGFPGLSPDGLLLFITSERSGGYGGRDVWISRRASASDPWERPVNMGPPFNTSAWDQGVVLSSDGSKLYFSTASGQYGRLDIWQAPVRLAVDFNGDARVDIEDLTTLIEHWGQNDPAHAMGPMLWGDGIVDGHDLEVLMSHWGQDDHFIAHWKLDETGGDIAYDSAGDNHAAVIGDSTWQRESGQVDGALQLDGIDDYLAAPFILDPTKQPFSIFAWIKGGQPGQSIISQKGGFGAWLSVDSAGALSTGLTFPFPPVTSNVVITDDLWHRIGLVSDGSGMSLYVDDIEVARSDTSPILPANGDLQIGAGKNLEPGAFWSGMIDDVRIYDRVVEP